MFVICKLRTEIGTEQSADDSMPMLLEKPEQNRPEPTPSTSKDSGIIVGRESLQPLGNYRKRKAEKLGGHENEKSLESLQKSVLELEIKKLELENKKLTNENYKLGLECTKLECEISLVWRQTGLVPDSSVDQIVPMVRETVLQNYNASPIAK